MRSAVLPPPLKKATEMVFGETSIGNSNSKSADSNALNLLVASIAVMYLLLLYLFKQWYDSYLCLSVW